MKVTDAQTWHPDVETFDLFEGEQLLGRIHLDMHPREGKYKHAAQFGLTVGAAGQGAARGDAGVQLPQGGRAAAAQRRRDLLPRVRPPAARDLRGPAAVGGISGIRTEWDFVEVPSMLLQEWPLDAGALKTFAKHHQTGEPIPRRAGGAAQARQGVRRGPRHAPPVLPVGGEPRLPRASPGFDTTEVLKEMQEKFLPFRREWVEGTHFELGFGHLDGYSAIYYTYQWSTVIAKDLLTRFKSQGHAQRRAWPPSTARRCWSPAARARRRRWCRTSWGGRTTSTPSSSGSTGSEPLVALRTGGAEAWTPAPDDTPFHRLGGHEGVVALVEAFYDDMEVHEPALAAVHRQDAPGKVRRRSRERFGLFLIGWLGGPQDYTEQHGHPRLRMRHGTVAVGVELRDAWLRSMGRAMDARGLTGAVRSFLDTRFGEVADFLRNRAG